jgi:ethanolamine utilization microcompartment shell protein EutS
MFWKSSFALCVLAIASQVTMAQNSAGNILSGDVKADVLKRYSGAEALPKPHKVLIQDFAVPARQVTTDESIAGELHRDVMLRHGVDEDSSPEVLAQQVQAAFAKTLANELKKVNIQTVNVPTQKISSANGPGYGSDLVVTGEFVAINEGDETKRIMIGFGRGASHIKTHVTVSSVTQGHSTVVMELNLSSESGKKPGAVATMGRRCARC